MGFWKYFSVVAETQVGLVPIKGDIDLFEKYFKTKQNKPPIPKAYFKQVFCGAYKHHIVHLGDRPQALKACT